MITCSYGYLHTTNSRIYNQSLHLQEHAIRIYKVMKSSQLYCKSLLLDERIENFVVPSKIWACKFFMAYSLSHVQLAVKLSYNITTLHDYSDDD